MNRIFFLFLITLIISLFSCNDEKRNDNKLDPAAIYFDYKITGEEGNDNLTVLLQYRDGGEDGDALAIYPPGKVLFDGEVILADSTKMSGAFYEMHKPIAQFAGRHSIIFTNNNIEYKEEFDFQPVVLLTRVADTIERNDLSLEFAGLGSKDLLRVLLTDTSFINDGINRLDTVVNGRLVISKGDLGSLSNGPVQLELIREYSTPVKNGTKRGGRLLITYSLKREFFLKN